MLGKLKQVLGKYKKNEIKSSASNSTKGTENDPMENQKISKRILDKETIDGLMNNIGLTKIIVEAPIVDMLKNEFYMLQNQIP